MFLVKVWVGKVSVVFDRMCKIPDHQTVDKYCHKYVKHSVLDNCVLIEIEIFGAHSGNVFHQVDEPGQVLGKLCDFVGRRVPVDCVEKHVFVEGRQEETRRLDREVDFQ